jgi:hypothetical protein
MPTLFIVKFCLGLFHDQFIEKNRFMQKKMAQWSPYIHKKPKIPQWSEREDAVMYPNWEMKIADDTY